MLTWLSSPVWTPTAKYLVIAGAAVLFAEFFDPHLEAIALWGGLAGVARWIAAKSGWQGGLTAVAGGIAMALMFRGVHLIEGFGAGSFVDDDARERVNIVLIAFGGPGLLGWLWDVIKSRAGRLTGDAP